MTKRKPKSPEKKTVRRKPRGLFLRVAATLGSTIARHPSVAGGCVAFTVIFSFVSANALWYQPGSHPSPMFRTRDANHSAAFANASRKPVPETGAVTTFKIERPDDTETASIDAAAAAAAAQPATGPASALVADVQQELIRRSAAEAASVGGALVVGINTDQLTDDVVPLDTVIDAYVEQLAFAEDAGAEVVLMASRHLARAAETAADYERVYAAVLARATKPVVLHWLGTAFDSVLEGYFGAVDPVDAFPVVQRIIEDNLDSVRGIKMSLLDADAEIALRSRLPEGATLFTGDDFNYVGLIEGAPDADGTPRWSDALLGAFAALAPSASAAIQALDAGDTAEYRRVLGPTEALSRQVFAAPTQYYKTGVAFLSWLNGHQPAFSMVGGLHSARSLPHLSEIVRLANASGALERPELAADRWTGLLALNGVDVTRAVEGLHLVEAVTA